MVTGIICLRVGPNPFVIVDGYGGDATGLEIMVIAGGGGGGNRTGGGGGAGGVAFASNIPIGTIPSNVSGSNIDVTVGSAGGPGPGPGNPSTWGTGQPWKCMLWVVEQVVLIMCLQEVVVLVEDLTTVLL